MLADIKSEINDNEKKKEESLNNFKSEDMSNLEKVDPWLQRKMEQQKRKEEEQETKRRTN